MTDNELERVLIYILVTTGPTAWRVDWRIYHRDEIIDAITEKIRTVRIESGGDKE